MLGDEWAGVSFLWTFGISKSGVEKRSDFQTTSFMVGVGALPVLC